MYSNKMDFHMQIDREHDRIYDHPMDNKVDKQIFVLFDILHKEDKFSIVLKFHHWEMPGFNNQFRKHKCLVINTHRLATDS